MRITGDPNLTARAWLRLSKYVSSTTAGNTMLSQDYKEFIQSLNDNGVLYLIVGGYAVALHGYPRYTKGIDIWIVMDAKNAARVIDALNQFGFASLGLKTDDFLEPDTIIQLGYPPNRVDLITTLPGVNFKSCFEARVETEIDGLLIHFIGLESLKQTKRSSARAQDLADLENLS